MVGRHHVWPIAMSQVTPPWRLPHDLPPPPTGTAWWPRAPIAEVAPKGKWKVAFHKVAEAIFEDDWSRAVHLSILFKAPNKDECE